MRDNKKVIYLYTSKDYEFIELDYNTFEIDGFDKNLFKEMGTLLLIMLNNFDKVIKILKEAGLKSSKDDMIQILEDGLISIDENLMNVIINDLNFNKEFLKSYLNISTICIIDKE